MKSTVTISGKTYDVEVIDGKRFIDGVTVDEFVERLSGIEMDRLATIGQIALRDEKEGRLSNYQDILSKIESAGNN